MGKKIVLWPRGPCGEGKENGGKIRQARDMLRA